MIINPSLIDSGLPVFASGFEIVDFSLLYLNGLYSNVFYFNVHASEKLS